MLAFWLDSADALSPCHPRGYASQMEALVRFFATDGRLVVHPLRTAPVILADGGLREFVVGQGRWGLVPASTPREAMRETAMKNLIVRADRAATDPSTEWLWSRPGGGNKTRFQCLIPVSGWLCREERGVVACRPEARPTLLAGLYNEIDVDGKPVLTFTILVEVMRSVYRDAGTIEPIVLKEYVRERWLSGESPRSAAWALNDGGVPTERRYLRNGKRRGA